MRKGCVSSWEKVTDSMMSLLMVRIIEVKYIIFLKFLLDAYEM